MSASGLRIQDVVNCIYSMQEYNEKQKIWSGAQKYR